MNKKVIVKKNDEVVQFAIFHDDQTMNDWIELLETNEAWGSPHKIINHLEQIIPQEALIIHHDEIVTPADDLVIHHEESIDANDEIVPAWDEIIPQAPIVTPAWDESIPQPDIVIPAWSEEIEAEYTIEIVDITDEINAKELQRKYDYLWKAANDFQSGQISGAAIGLLTIGVLAQKPKCTAVQAWIKSVWVEYYTRKAGVDLQNNVNLDFSVCGNIPYTVPELMEEVSI